MPRPRCTTPSEECSTKLTAHPRSSSASPAHAKQHQIARLVERSPHRYDLTYSTDRDGHRTPVFTLATDLPFGAASTFAAVSLTPG